MNTDLIQNLRYKLQKRTRRLNSLEFKVFHHGLKQYWGFLHSNQIIASVLEELARQKPEMLAEAEKIGAGEDLVFDTEIDNVAAAYFLLKLCAASENTHAELSIGHAYSTGGHGDECLDAFRSVFVEPLYDYIDEHLDDQRATLAVLRRYKHRCEWFQRERLANLWSGETQKGEHALARDLYEYLFDHGIDISIEPASASGKADFVGAQTGDDRLVADAKIFTEEKGKSHVASAFHQIYTYTLDYNQPFGYLVIFKLCPQDLKFPFVAQEQSVPCITHNNKTIFILVIDIYPHEQSASKRGPLKTIEITESELVQAL